MENFARSYICFVRYVEGLVIYFWKVSFHHMIELYLLSSLYTQIVDFKSDVYLNLKTSINDTIDNIGVKKLNEASISIN